MEEYNTSRNQLLIREYGRNVQQMVEQLLLVEDIDKRTEGAKAVVKVMAQLASDNNSRKDKDTLDYWHKLWDHLFIISDYRLEVNAPFPKPVREEKKPVVETYSYDKSKIMNRTYGRNMERIIKTVANYPAGPEKEHLTKVIANHLKKLYLTWNRDSVNDELIMLQLNEMSDGKLSVSEDFQLDATKDILLQNNLYKKSSENSGQKKKKKKKKKKSNLSASI